MKRGAFQFETTAAGNLINNAKNVETLRRLWLDRTLVQGYYIGPGDPGDFDVGAWHVACHLAGAGGMMQHRDGKPLWLEISHDAPTDTYYASVTGKLDNAIRTVRLDSAEGRTIVAGAKVLGYVEGNSVGRTSARGLNDPPTLFNLWRRQDFDQPVDTEVDGGKVWEHWCTLRDIRASARIGTSVLTAYVSLVSALGDLFTPAVARGRQDYGHPEQLVALVQAGFTGEASAVWNGKPLPLPPEAERLLLEAEPSLSLQAIEKLMWTPPPRYYMYKRRIDHWNPAANVRRDLADG